MEELRRLREQQRELTKTIADTRRRLGVLESGGHYLIVSVTHAGPYGDFVMVWSDGWGGAWMTHYGTETGPRYYEKASWFFEDYSRALKAAKTYRGMADWVQGDYEGDRKPPDLKAAGGLPRGSCPYAP